MGKHNRNEIEPKISFVVIDSRSDEHPQWVVASIDSVRKQNIPVELIVVNNIGRKKSIGQCYNEGVRAAKCDLVAFVGDDDYIAFELGELLWRWFEDAKIRESNIVRVSTGMTAFNDETGDNFPINREWTGCWKRDYLLKYPFNEELKSSTQATRLYSFSLIAFNSIHFCICFSKALKSNL